MACENCDRAFGAHAFYGANCPAPNKGDGWLFSTYQEGDRCQNCGHGPDAHHEGNNRCPNPMGNGFMLSRFYKVQAPA